MDHRPALAVADKVTLAKLHEAAIPLVLIPSCLDCNGRLGSKPIFTAMEACVFLAENLALAYEKRSTLWTYEELDEMGPSFQSVLRARKRQAELLLLRVRHAQERVLDEDLMPRYVSPDPDA